MQIEIVAVLLIVVFGVTFACWKLVEMWEEWRSQRGQNGEEGMMFPPKSPEDS
jgi:hypothetical protein